MSKINLLHEVMQDPRAILFSQDARNAATNGGSGASNAGIRASVTVERHNQPKLRFSFHPDLVNRLGWKPGETRLDVRLSPPVAGSTTEHTMRVALFPLNNGNGRALSMPAASAKCRRAVSCFVLRQPIWHSKQGSGEIGVADDGFADITVDGDACAFHLPF